MIETCTYRRHNHLSPPCVQMDWALLLVLGFSASLCASADINDQPRPLNKINAELNDRWQMNLGNQWSPACAAEFEEVGITNETLYLLGTQHEIHSISVRDIWYYFDPTFPEDNDMPTINWDLTSNDTVLPYTPLGGDFFTPEMRAMDNIMSHNHNYGVGGVGYFEALGHTFHMIETWERASGVCKNVTVNPPSGKLCSCIFAEEIPLINRTMVRMHKAIKGFQDDVILHDQNTWTAYWRDELIYSMPEDQHLFAFCMYFYCKMQQYKLQYM